MSGPPASAPSGSADASNGTDQRESVSSQRDQAVPTANAPPATVAGAAKEPAADVSPAAAPSSTLYVCDLDPITTEMHLHLAFADVAASLKTVRIARDPITQRSLGYGYVNFLTPEAAQHALDTHVPLFVGASMCRVFLYPGKHTFERPGKIAGEGVFIKNLDPLLQVSELYQAFRPFGDILGCRIALGDYGRPRGFAYVSYRDHAAAVNAVNDMNGSTFRSRRLFVGHNIPRRDRVHKYDDNKEAYTNLFIKGIAAMVREEEFFEFFAALGPIDSYSMPLDEYNAPRGFGFVNYKSHEHAVRAVETLNGKSLCGRELFVARAQQRDSADRVSSSPTVSHAAAPASQQGTNLYVKYLDSRVTDVMLSDTFKEFGTVLSAKIMMDAQGASRGFGFVSYQSPEAADAAITGLNNTTHWGNQLYVAPAQRRDRRGWFRGGSPSIQNGMPAQPIFPYMPFNMMGLLPALPGTQFSPQSFGQWDDPSHYGSSVDSSSDNVSSSGTPTAQYTHGTWGYQPYLQQYMYQPQQQYLTPSYYQPASYNRPSTSELSPTESVASARRVKKQKDFAPSLAAAVASAENTAAEKQVIGEALYPKVLNHPHVGDAELASRLTGILLEEDRDSLLEWVDDDATLSKRIQQACEAFKTWQSQQ